MCCQSPHNPVPRCRMRYSLEYQDLHSSRGSEASNLSVHGTWKHLSDPYSEWLHVHHTLTGRGSDYWIRLHHVQQEDPDSKKTERHWQLRNRRTINNKQPGHLRVIQSIAHINTQISIANVHSAQPTSTAGRVTFQSPIAASMLVLALKSTCRSGSPSQWMLPRRSPIPAH